MPSRTPQDPTIPVSVSPEETPWASLPPTAPSLEAAFTCLCEALLPYLEDNVPAYSHVVETMAIFADGNHAIGWGRMVLVLEGALGTPLVVR
jgi:hypothetical protein